MEKINLEGLNETIYKHVTKEGLVVYVWPNEKVKGTLLSLSVRYGSNHTDFKVNNKEYHTPTGIAHFLEHIKFNVDKDTTAHDIFNSNGADANAFTTFLYTSYIVFATSNIESNLKTLLDFVYTPYFTKQTIAKEKGIIIEEANMGLDNPYNSSYFEHLKQIFKKSHYRNEITGLAKDIKSISLEDILLIYNTFYHPKNMFLVVTGNVNPYEIAKNTDEVLSKKTFSDYTNPKIIIPKEDKKVLKKYIETKKNVVNSKLRYGIKIPLSKFKNYDKYVLKIYLNIIMQLNFGLSSDFYEEIYNESLIYNMYPTCNIFDDYVLIDIVVDTDYMDEVKSRIANKLNNLVVKEEDFLRRKKVNIANMILQFDDIETINSVIQNNLIEYNDIIANQKEIYNNINYNDIKEILNLLSLNEYGIYVVKPKDKDN